MAMPMVGGREPLCVVSILYTNLPATEARHNVLEHGDDCGHVETQLSSHGGQPAGLLVWLLRDWIWGDIGDIGADAHVIVGVAIGIGGEAIVAIVVG